MKLPKSISKILNLKPAPWEKFYSLTWSRFDKGFKQLSAKEIEIVSTEYSKAYARFPNHKLPRPSIQKHTIYEALFKRVSSRTYSTKKIDSQTLSNILYFGAGIKRITRPEINSTSRFYPSAGGRYPIETYVINLHITGLKKGVYHYYPKSHMLEHVAEVPFDLPDYFYNSWVTSASFIVVFTSVFGRSTMKYGDRGYNYACMEAGHIGQNISLVAAAHDIGSCGIGGFLEEKVNSLLDIRLPEESSLYCMSFGPAKT